MLFTRTIASQIQKALQADPRVIIIYGPRQAGKTTLIHQTTAKLGQNTKISFFTGDDLYAQNLLGKNELTLLKRALAGTELLIVDEAQRIENIGLTLKLVLDNLGIKILVSGSASFDLANKLSEPLTGRTRTFFLYPLAYKEAQEKYQQTDQKTALEEMLRFGMYPRVHTLKSDQEKMDYLYEYINNYLYKDLLSFNRVKKPKKVIDLLALLALQTGNEVSVAELAQNLALSQKTVVSYLDVLEKMFVLFNLRGFSRNLRKEIYKISKYYFWDLGVRNALIRNFNPLNLRQDAGALFESWFIGERMKVAGNNFQPANFYFWRTYDQQEIDLIEERGGALSAYECKWKAGGKEKAPKDWARTYGRAKFSFVNAENYFQYLT